MRSIFLTLRRQPTPVGAFFLVVAACAGTRQASSVDRSSFLPPEVELRQGKGDEPLWVFVNPTESLASYDSVVIEPVEIWYGNAAKRSGTSTEDLEHLATLLHTSLDEALQRDYLITDTPGPTTLRIRLALTDADAAKPIGNMVTTFVPRVRRIAALSGRFLNVRVWTGAASVEGEVLDSVTGERLMAAIDRRIGTKSPDGAWDQWDDVEQAFDHWARWIRDRMESLRARE